MAARDDPSPVAFLAAERAPAPEAVELLRELSVSFAMAHGAAGDLLVEISEGVARAVERAIARDDDGRHAHVRLEAHVDVRSLEIVVALSRGQLRRAAAPEPEPGAPSSHPHAASASNGRATRLRFVLGG